MPGQHSDNTKLLGFYADLALADKVDEARGSTVRSQFLREAVVEYMEKRGFPVPEELKNAPDRAGKGGPKASSKKGQTAAGKIVYHIAKKKKPSA